MLLPNFNFYEPDTIEGACKLMVDLGQDTRPIAGGTDLLVNMKKKNLAPENLVSICRIDKLKKINDNNGSIRIGACCTASEIAESETVMNSISALGIAAKNIGSPLIRNLATIGGNIVSARPAADLPPVVMVYKGKVLLKRASGERLVPVEEFFKGPGQTISEPDEILTEIVMEKPSDFSGTSYLTLGVRKALEISLASVAVLISLDKPGGIIEEVRIALGSVAPTTIRAFAAEKILLGKKPSTTLFIKAGEAASNESSPIDDFRASAEYKRVIVEVFTRRALEDALNNVKAV